MNGELGSGRACPPWRCHLGHCILRPEGRGEVLVLESLPGNGGEQLAATRAGPQAMAGADGSLRIYGKEPRE